MSELTRWRKAHAIALQLESLLETFPAHPSRGQALRNARRARAALQRAIVLEEELERDATKNGGQTE